MRIEERKGGDGTGANGDGRIATPGLFNEDGKEPRGRQCGQRLALDCGRLSVAQPDGQEAAHGKAVETPEGIEVQGNVSVA